MPEVQATRANTLDGILDELPDFSDGYFSYPVDDFFPQYVERLGQGGAREPLQQDGGGSGSGTFMQFSDILPSNSNSYQPGHTQPLRNGQQLPTVVSMDLGFDIQEPAVFLPQNNNQVQTNNQMPNQAAVDYPNTMMQMPHIGSAPQNGDHSEGSGSMAGSGDLGHRTSSRGRQSRSRVNSDYHIDSADESDEAENTRRGTRAPGKAKRNAKQQAQNKQAQQRYRERRKQRFNDMEHAIDELNTRLQQMQTIKSQNAVLVAKSHELNSMIEARDAEIDRLRVQFQDGGLSPKAEQSLEERRQAEQALISDFQGKTARDVQEMKDFIEKHKLQNASPTGEGVDPQVLQQISALVGRQCGAHQSMRPDGVKLLRLMSADMGQLTRIKCIRKRDTLQKGYASLRLSDTQKQQLLMLRTNHLNSLKDVYVERQQLNMQAMAVMLPNAGTQQSAQNTIENKLERMRHASYRRIAAHAVDLDEVLNSIKENLRKEQKRVIEMNFVTLHRILTPIQAAMFVVTIFPMNFDALELANFLALESLDPNMVTINDDHDETHSSSKANGTGSGSANDDCTTQQEWR